MDLNLTLLVTSTLGHEHVLSSQLVRLSANVSACYKSRRVIAPKTNRIIHSRDNLRLLLALFTAILELFFHYFTIKTHAIAQQ